MRNIICFIIAFMLSISAWAFHDFKYGDCYYNIISNTPPYTVTVAQGWQLYNGSWGLIPYSGDIVIPDSVVYNNICYKVVAIQDLIFNSCPALTSVRVGNNIHAIGKHAFSNNPRLKKVILPETLTTIGEEAFTKCDSLHTVNIPQCVTTVGKNLFDKCPLLDTVIWNLRDAFLDIKPFYNNDDISHLIIGDSVTCVGTSAFYGCNNLTTVEWGKNLKTIGAEAFRSTGFRSLILREGIDSIAQGAFANCNKLKVVSIPSSLRCIDGISSGTVNNSNLRTFGSCTYIDSVYWNANNCLVSQPFHASWNSHIRVVEFGDSIRYIRDKFCYNFDSLTTVIYPKHVKQIGGSAFYDCNKLTEFTIHDSVTKIAGYAFYGCNNLDSVHVYTTTPPTLGNQPFNSSPACLIPCGTLEAYQNSTWINYMRSIEQRDSMYMNHM